MGERSEPCSSCRSDKGILSEAKDTRQNWRLSTPILAMKQRSWLLACQSHKANWKIKRYFSEKNMTKNLLVELGLEELPAYVVTPSEKQLGEKNGSLPQGKPPFL